jgi:hypothetical protein
LPLFLSVALAAFASFGRRDLDPVFAVRSKHAVEAGEVDPRFGNQRSKPGQKIQRLEDDVHGCTNAAGAGCAGAATWVVPWRRMRRSGHMGGAVPIGRFQFVADPSVIQKRQAFLGYRRACNIPAQPLQRVTLMRLSHYPGM